MSYTKYHFVLSPSEITSLILNSHNPVEIGEIVNIVDMSISKMMRVTATHNNSPKKDRNPSKANKTTKVNKTKRHRRIEANTHLYQTPTYSSQLPFLLGHLNIMLGVVISFISKLLLGGLRFSFIAMKLIVSSLKSEIVRSLLIVVCYSLMALLSFIFSVLFNSRTRSTT